MLFSLEAVKVSVTELKPSVMEINFKKVFFMYLNF